VAFFLIKHAPESIEIGAILHKTRDIDLRANEVTEIPSRVEKWRGHQKIHKWRSITATIFVVNQVLTRKDRNGYLLVQEDLAVIFSFSSRFSKALYTASIRLRTLKETAVASNRVPNAILRRTMEF
jgi:hypothetical protein